MKKFALIALGLLTATAITTSAQDKKKKELTDDQKKVMKEITEKYDANKNGKLEPEEREKISEDDKKKMKDAGIAGPGKKKEK
jgi:hypothetical protein